MNNSSQPTPSSIPLGEPQSDRSPARASTLGSFGSLRERLLVLVVLTLLIPTALTAWLLQRHAAERLRLVEDEMSDAAGDAVRQQAALVTQVSAMLAGLAQVPENWRTGPECSENLRVVMAGATWGRDIGVADSSGDLLCTSQPLPGQVNLADRAYFQRVLTTRQPAVSDLLTSRSAASGLILVAAQPVLDPAGKVTAVIFAGIGVEAISNRAKRGRERAQADVALIVDATGTIIAREPDTAGTVGENRADHPLVAAMLAQRSGVIRLEGLDAVRRVYAFAPLPDTSAVLAIGRNEQELLAPAMQEAGQAFGLLAAGSLLAGLLAWWFGRAVMLLGVDRIVATAREGGSFAAIPTDLRASVEVVDLLAALVENEQQRAASEARWRALGAAGAQVIWRASAAGEPLEALGWEALTGQPCTAVLSGAWAEQVHPDDRAGLRAAWMAGLETGHAFAAEFRLARGAATPAAWAWFRLEAVPVRQEGGEAIAEWVGIMRDIDVVKNAGLALLEREGRLTSVLATAAEAIVLVDDRGMIHQSNAAAEHIFGWSAEELVGRSAAVLMPAMLGRHHDARVAAHADNGSGAILGMRRELEGRRRDGSVFPLEITVTQWADGAGRSWYTGVMRDVSAQREAAAALEESEARFRLLAEHSGDVVALNDIDGTRRYVSPAVERVLGWQPEDIVGRKGSEFIHPDDRPLLAEALAAMRAGVADTTVTYRHRRADGSWLWVDGRARLLPAAEGAPPDRYVVVLRDASLRKGAEARLQETLERLAQMAATDGLTGINNRRGFDSALEREWRQSEREQLPLSVALVDADSFKLFNDHYGHLAGDDCLHTIAAQVQAAGRRPSDVAARYGGEEFVLLMPDTDEAGALLVAERLRRMVEAVGIQHARNKAGAGIVTVSVGVATVRPYGGEPTPKALLETADAALYRAKERGRNCVEGADLDSPQDMARAVFLEAG